jgi:hypothetical protein
MSAAATEKTNVSMVLLSLECPDNAGAAGSEADSKTSSCSIHFHAGRTIEAILSRRIDCDGFDYFVKLTGRPYRSCRWITVSELYEYPNADRIMIKYHENVVFRLLVLRIKSTYRSKRWLARAER